MHFLILDAGCQLHGQGGTLNHFLTKVARETLEGFGHTVAVTEVGGEWQVEEERKKILAADVVIVQTPGWWMSPPWQLKRYEDEIFTGGPFLTGDGRTRTAPTKNYGTGGLLREKRYLLSSTWNAPREAFDEPGDFFEGRGIDGVLFPLHKTFQFLGMQPLPSFMMNDVIKNPTIEADTERWKTHLTALFGTK